MTEPKPKAAPAPHVAGAAPSPSRAASPLAGPPEPDPFQALRSAAASPAGPPLPLSLDGLLFPRAGAGQEPPGGPGGGDPALPEPDGAYAGGEAAPGGRRPPDKDGGLLDSVLDTLLAPPGPASPAACGAAPWCLFGPELPEAPGAPPRLVSRPPGKDEGVPGAAVGVAHKAPPESPAGQPPKGRPRAAAAAPPPAGGAPPGPRDEPRFPAPRPGPAAEQEPAAPRRPSPLAASLMDLIHLPILPIGPAFLAARTRHLLEAEGYEGPPRDSPASSAAPGAGGDFPDCAFPPDEEPKEDPYPLYGDFQPPALKIKEEEEGGDGAGRAPHSYLGPGPALGPDYAARAADAPAAPAGAPAPAAPAAAAPLSTLECVLYKAEAAPPQPGPFGPLHCKGPGAGGCLLPRDSLPSASAPAAAGVASALYPPLGLNGLPQLGYQAAVLKEGLPQVYPPYLNYLRPDTEASQSPQYGFESLPQKICLICGDEASGCHYGVLTCGSCKVFFKRAMEGQHNYLCAGRNDCIVDKIRRKNCPACRLRKCCQAGMVLGGRKFKKFNKVRVMRALDAVALPQTVGLPNENQALTQRITFSPNQEVQLIPPLMNLLLSIEPEVIYAGYDNTKPETSSSLLNSLNLLAERQLLSVVKWSKSLPGFRNLHIDDQITLIQYSWMSLMVFGLGWRSYKHVSGQMLYFAPDLILNEQRMKESSFYSLCLTMWQIPQEFVKLQVTQEEFLCMKVLLLLNTIPLEGLRSQNQFDEMRSSYIRELIKAIGLRQKGVVASSQRFYQLTRFMDSLHDLVKQLHLFCLNTFIQSRTLSVEFPEMMSEVIAAQLPKILAGMVKPLLFHKK
ncbi:progesterone receptor [Macrotis lagotis]|uniref:progesterone receptor n=1 Tax=Macrotis lagotis TaxID=92651 RepID=UPI003D69E059